MNANVNKNDVKSTNVNANANIQGQQQGQSQSSRNDNRSSASNEGNNSSQTVNVGGDTYEATKIPVATAFAPSLIAGTNTCMGSSSVGGQGITFGFSVGTTWEDKGCTRRSNAQTLNSLGLAKAAVALMCQDSDVALAMKQSNMECYVTSRATSEGSTSVSVVSTIPAEASQAQRDNANPDNIIRWRLGLPPLANK